VCVCIAVWLSAIVAVTIISLVGLAAVVLIPVMSRRTFYNHLLHFLVAVAIATLTGDAFLHLLPHVSLPITYRLLEMCIGMGFPVGMRIPWDSHGNGNANDFRGSWSVGKCFAKKIAIDIKLKAK